MALNFLLMETLFSFTEAKLFRFINIPILIILEKFRKVVRNLDKIHGSFMYIKVCVRFIVFLEL